MSAEPNFLDVKIMGREYRVACHIEERPALLAAVELVDSKMREIAQKTKNTIAERVAGQMDKGDLDQRMDQINRFEAMLVNEGALVLKFWFHLSRDGQRQR